MNKYENNQQTEYYIRPHLANQKMKFAQAKYQTVYLYGVSGCGKTSFIKDYFGKRQYVYLSAHKLTPQDLDFGIGSTKTVVVLDDLYLLGLSDEDELIKRKINELVDRRDIWLVLMNRCKVPRWLTATYLKHMFMVIEEQDFCLSYQEIKSYFSLWHISLSEEEIEKARQLSLGIGINIRVMAMHLSKGEPFDKEHIEIMRGEIWDYLEQHVYEKWELEMLEFFMQVCIVEQFNTHLAEMITGRNDVRGIIDKAKETGNFIIEKGEVDKETIYEVSLPVRRSMQRRMERTYSLEKKKQFYYNAGLYYELEGDLPNALHMYEKYRNNERISSLIIANARKDPSAGHYYELKKYYLELPEGTIKESVELMAGMSMLQSMLMNIDESERWYEELRAYASNQAGSLRKAAKSKLTYLDIALPHRGSASLVEIFKNVGILLRNKDIVLPEFSVTSNLPSMMNGGKDFCEWSKKDKELARSIGRIVEVVLGKYGKGLVNLALAESYFEKGENDYETSSYANKGKMQAEAGGKIEQCFVANGILAWLHVLNNNAIDGAELLRDFYQKAESAGAVKLLPNIRAFQCRVQMYYGETAEVIKWMQEAPNEEMDFNTMERFRYLTKVRGYLILGKLEKADGLLQRLLVYSEMMKRTYISIEAKVLLAITQYRMKNKDWKETLTQCLEEAKPYHFVRMISREGAPMWELLESYKGQTKVCPFMQQVMKETEKMARSYPSYLKEQTERINFNENALEILKLQSEGLSITQIANETGMSVANIKYHCQQTYRKLGVNGKAAAVIEARKRNII